MIRFFMPLIRRLQKLLVYLPDNRGIKFLLRLQRRVDNFVFATIKIKEISRGGIHPKHWITDFHTFFLDNIDFSDSVLEVGCAYGHIANSLAKKAKKVTAIDIRPEAIDKARRQFKRSNLVFINSDLFKFPDSERFDAIVLSNVLEHIDERKRFLEKTAVLAKKLLIRVPAFDRDWWVPYRKEFGLEWRLNKDHKLEYTEDALRKELDAAGLIAKSIFCQWGNYCCVAMKREAEIK